MLFKNHHLFILACHNTTNKDLFTAQKYLTFDELEVLIETKNFQYDTIESSCKIL